MFISLQKATWLIQQITFQENAWLLTGMAVARSMALSNPQHQLVVVSFHGTVSIIKNTVHKICRLDLTTERNYCHMLLTSPRNELHNKENIMGFKIGHSLRRRFRSTSSFVSVYYRLIRISTMLELGVNLDYKYDEAKKKNNIWVLTTFSYKCVVVDVKNQNIRPVRFRNSLVYSGIAKKKKKKFGLDWCHFWTPNFSEIAFFVQIRTK